MKNSKLYPFFRPGDLILLCLLAISYILIPSGINRNCEDYFLLVVCPSCELEINLDADSIFQVNGNIGSLLVEIRERKAAILQSPCSGQQCVRTGWLENPGDMSICMPSGVFLSIESRNGNTSDAVSY